MASQKTVEQLNREVLLSDKYIHKLLKKMPEALQDSFSNAQLESISKTMGSASWKVHKLDVRNSISLFSYRYYYVLIAGRDLREIGREQVAFKRLIYSIFFSLFIIFCTLLGLLTLYLIKSAMGINLFPHFSLGIWSWFKELFSF